MTRSTSVSGEAGLLTKLSWSQLNGLEAPKVGVSSAGQLAMDAARRPDLVNDLVGVDGGKLFWVRLVWRDPLLVLASGAESASEEVPVSIAAGADIAEALGVLIDHILPMPDRPLDQSVVSETSRVLGLGGSEPDRRVARSVIVKPSGTSEVVTVVSVDDEGTTARIGTGSPKGLRLVPCGGATAWATLLHAVMGA